MSDYKVTDTQLTSIANAIRSKTGKSARIEFPTEFVSEIGSISGGSAYELLDYIQSDGTQYIDLGIKFQSGDRINALWENVSSMTGYRWVLGAGIQNGYIGVVLAIPDNEERFYAGGGTFIALRTFAYGASRPLTNTISASSSKNVVVFGYNPYSESPGSYNWSKIKLYAIAISNNVFLPCRRKSDNVCGLWDCTNSQLLTDAANGNAFTAGNVLLEF